MFLHKFDILKRNLNGLFQKFKPVVTKLCAVTKLGDLTVINCGSDSGSAKVRHQITVPVPLQQKVTVLVSVPQNCLFLLIFVLVISAVNSRNTAQIRRISKSIMNENFIHDSFEQV